MLLGKFFPLNYVALLVACLASLYFSYLSRKQHEFRGKHLLETQLCFLYVDSELNIDTNAQAKCQN